MRRTFLYARTYEIFVSIFYDIIEVPDAKIMGKHSAYFRPNNCIRIVTFV